ncbi:MAG: hypothetical protein H6707_17990 [Deltaproteobacteria bacterium]|nr:hypothetical protein [Deltaproteobacteria bacterium]
MRPRQGGLEPLRELTKECVDMAHVVQHALHEVCAPAVQEKLAEVSYRYRRIVSELTGALTATSASTEAEEIKVSYGAKDRCEWISLLHRVDTDRPYQVIKTIFVLHERLVTRLEKLLDDRHTLPASVKKVFLRQRESLQVSSTVLTRALRDQQPAEFVA